MSDDDDDDDDGDDDDDDDGDGFWGMQRLNCRLRARRL